MAFRHGAYLRQALTCRVIAPGRIALDFAPAEGGFSPWWHGISVSVHGWDGPAAVTSGGSRIDARADTASATLRFDLPDMRAGGHVAIN
jgi:hypothetical protein